MPATRKQTSVLGQAKPKAPTGVKLIDHLLDGGPGKGSIIYLAGTPGTGRSVMAAQFVTEARAGLWISVDGLEPGLTPPLLRALEARHTEGTLRTVTIDSIDPETGAAQIAQLKPLRPDRIVVWAADLLELNNPALATSLLQALRSSTATVLLIGTVGGFGQDAHLQTPRLLSYSDNVILTQARLDPEDPSLLARLIKATPPAAGPLHLSYLSNAVTITVVDEPEAPLALRTPANKKLTIVPELFYLNNRHQDIVRSQLDQAAKSFPHTDFTLHGPPFANSVQYNEQLDEVKAGRQQWDLFIVDICRLREVIDLGMIQPLDSFLPDNWENQYLKVAVDQCRVNGRIWALPHWINIGILVYRQDLLNKYSLPVPGTWPELVETAQRVMKGEKQDRMGGFTFQGAQVEALTCNFLEFLWGNGGSVYDSSLHVNLAAPEAVEALQFMCDLVHKHKVSPKETPSLTEIHTQRMFLEHRMLFTRSWPKFLRELPQTFSAPADKVSIAHLPTLSPGISPRGIIGGFCYVIGRHVTDPGQLINFHSAFYSPGMIRRLAREGQMCSPYKSVYEDATLLATNQHLAQIPQLLEAGLSRGAIPHYAKLTEVVQREVNAALRQMKSPADALAAAADDLHKHIFRHHREQRLANALDYVEQHLHEDICRDKAAQACHLAPSYFSAIFSDVIGCSFTRYVSEKRIERARDLLERSGLTIAEVGQKVGFKDQSYFCQVFRQYTNMTPTEYRVNAMTNASHH